MSLAGGWSSHVQFFYAYSGCAKAILAHLNAELLRPYDPCHVIVTDLKEEVFVYIHGNPFVLRELEQPVNTLKHIGVSA